MSDDLMTAAGIQNYCRDLYNSRPDAEAEEHRLLAAAKQSTWTTMQGLLKSSEARGEFLASERREYDRLEAELARIQKRVDELAPLYSPAPGRIPITDTSSPARTTRTLQRDDPMLEWARRSGLVRHDQEQLSFSRWLKGAATGDWTGAEAERRALSEGTLGAGGYLVPTPLSMQIIDRARNAAAVMRAGATTVPMDAATLKVARVAGDMTAAWHTENAAIAESDMTFESVTLTARTLTSIVRASRELIEDTDVEDELERAFAAQLALTLDLAALYGSGTPPEPRGVKNTSGVTTQTSGANGTAVANYDFLIDAVGTLWDNNEEATGVIMAPRTARSLGKLRDTTQQPLRIPPVLEGIPRYTTNQVPVNLTVGTSTDTSDAFVADWRELLVGIRSSFQVEVLRERYADSFQYGFLAHLRADIVAARPKAFVVVTGLRP